MPRKRLQSLQITDLIKTLEIVHGTDDDPTDKVLEEKPASFRPTREKIQRVIGDAVRIRDISIYIQACTHKSAEQEVGYCQERLEHLGDSILAACVTSLLFQRFPFSEEGVLSRLRTKLVNGVTLASIGRKMNIQEVLVLGSCGAGAPQHDKVYEDTLEALVGAVFLDLGFQEAENFVKDIIERHTEPEYVFIEDNYKEVLRRYALRHRFPPAVFASRGERDSITCTCTFMTPTAHVTEEATAATKRKAEMESAKNVLITLGYDITAESIMPS